MTARELTAEAVRINRKRDIWGGVKPDFAVAAASHLAKTV